MLSQIGPDYIYKKFSNGPKGKLENKLEIMFEIWGE